MTKSLRQLENELGAVLLARGVRGARPTELGRSFLARARAVSADLIRAREELAQMQGSRAGGLTIGSAPGPALGLLPEALARRIAQLADAEWIRSGYPTDSSALPEKFEQAGLPPPRYRVECPSFLMVPELVARSDLLAVVPWQIAAREARTVRLIRIPIRKALPARPISLYRRADVPPTPIAGECTEILREIARR